MKSKNEKWALFWCNLLHPVIFDEIERAGFWKVSAFRRSYSPTESGKDPVFPLSGENSTGTAKMGFSLLSGRHALDII